MIIGVLLLLTLLALLILFLALLLCHASLLTVYNNGHHSVPPLAKNCIIFPTLRRFETVRLCSRRGLRKVLKPRKNPGNKLEVFVPVTHLFRSSQSLHNHSMMGIVGVQTHDQLMNHYVGTQIPGNYYKANHLGVSPAQLELD